MQLHRACRTRGCGSSANWTMRLNRTGALGAWQRAAGRSAPTVSTARAGRSRTYATMLGRIALISVTQPSAMAETVSSAAWRCVQFGSWNMTASSSFAGGKRALPPAKSVRPCRCAWLPGRRLAAAHTCVPRPRSWAWGWAAYESPWQGGRAPARRRASWRQSLRGRSGEKGGSARARTRMRWRAR